MNQSERWPSRPTWGRFVVSLVLSAIFVIPAIASGQQPRSVRPATPENSAALLDGVVVSPWQGFAYVMRAGGIDAVNLANGHVRWRSDKAAKPLALIGDRLIAQGAGRALDLVVLDARTGAARETVRIPLPAGVVATVVDTPAGSFRVRTDSTASELMVRWEATGTGVAQGYMPAENEGQAPEATLQSASVIAGEAILNLASPALTLKAEPSVRLAQSGALSRAAMEELSAPAVAGIAGRQLLSADGRHVLVTEPVESADFTLYRHRWTLYERDSGARLGSMPAMVSATPFLVVGTTLYHTVPAHAVRKDGKFAENPATLRAVNLTAGVEAWKTALLETSFRGPFPP